MEKRNLFGLNPLDRAIEEFRERPVGISLPQLERPGEAAEQPSFEPDSRNPAPLRTEAGQATQPARASRMLPPPEFQPLFERAASRYNVPLPIVMALGLQESSYNPNATGQPTKWGRAMGMMQYLDSTAKAMGINPYDPAQAVDAAAKQIRERLDKGYSMEDAVKEHFAGPNRKLWGAKTKQYGIDVMSKAERIAGLLGQGGFHGAPVAGGDPAMLGDDGQVMPGLTAPAGRSQQEHDPLLMGNSPSETALQNFLDHSPEQQDIPEAEAAKAEGESGTGSLLLESLKSGAVNVAAGVAYAPEALLRSVEGVLSHLDNLGRAIGLPDWMLERKYVGPTDIVEPLIRGKDFGSYHAAGSSDIAKLIKKAGEAVENEQHAKAIAEIAKSADDAMSHAIETGDFGPVVDVIADPDAWAVAFGQAAPSLAVAMLGGLPAIAALEGGSALNDIKEFEEKNGKIGDIEAANAIIQTATINALLEKLGLDAMMGKLPKSVQSRFLGAATEGIKGRLARGASRAVVGGVGETVTEAAQTVNQNLAKRHYDESQDLSEGVLLGAMGGGVTGGSVGAATGAASDPVRDDDSLPPPASDQPAPSQQPIAEPQIDNRGPLTRALDAGEQAASEARVVAITPAGPISGFLESHSPDGAARILGDNGQIYHFTPNDPVRIVPEADFVATQTAFAEEGLTVDPETGEIIEAGGAENAGSVLAEAERSSDPELSDDIAASAEAVVEDWRSESEASTDAASSAEPVSEQASATEPDQPAGQGVSDASGADQQNASLTGTTPVEEMTLEQLVERRAYIEEQKDLNGGWSKRLIRERDRVEAAVQARLNPAQPQPTSITTESGHPLVELYHPREGVRVLVRQDQWDSGQAQIPTFNSDGKRNAGGLSTVPRSVLRTPERVEDDVRARADEVLDRQGIVEPDNIPESAYVTDEAASQETATPTAAPQATQPAESQAVQDFIDGKRADAPTVEEVQAEQQESKPQTISKEDAEHLFGVDKNREAALKRIEAGRAWFGDKTKAQAFITKNGLSDTHTVEQTGAKRFEVKTKDQQAATGDDAGARGATTRPAPAESVSPSAARSGEETAPSVGGARQAGPNGYTFLSDDQATKIQRQFADKEVESLAIGRAEDGYLNFGEQYPDGRYRVASIDKVVGFDGKGGWETVGEPTKQSGAYDINAEPAAEVARVLSELGAKKKAVSVTRTPGVTTFVIDPSASVSPPNQTTVKEEAPAAPASDADARFANNKIFTADKVAAARERLRSKLGQINSGIDPETLIDGMTIAGAYIESGVRNFSDYAQRMVADLGDGVKPYLLSFWEGARNYPGLNTDGMTDVAESKRQFDGFITPADSQIAAVGEVVEKPAKRTIKTGKAADRTLVNDWGVDHIDGWTETAEGDGQPSDFGMVGGVKDAFLKDARAYLNAASANLISQGYTPHDDAKGRAMKPVRVSEEGPASSGAVSLSLRDVDRGVNLYVHISASALRVMVPSTASGVSIMYRVSRTEGDTYATSGNGNRWAPIDLSAADLATLVDTEVSRIAAWKKSGINDETEATSNERAQPAADAGSSAEGPSASRVPQNEADGATGDLFGQPDGRSDAVDQRGDDAGDRRSGRDQRSDAARADDGVGATDSRGSGALASDRGAADGAESGRAGTQRANEPVRSDERRQLSPRDGRPVSAPRNYRIKPGEITREGSWKATAERNIEIVELVKRLEQQGRMATPEEKALLTRFTGWGASEIANGVFPDRYGRFKPGWETLGERLKSALTPEEYANAKRSTQYAHYTSEGVIRSIYQGLERFGFKGGQVMEPGMGIGLFAGLMPDTIASGSTYTGIEFDNITGSIAKHLYPQSNIIVGDFTRTNLPANYFDAAIGNPPFSSTVISNDPEYKRHRFMLHDYFFAKTIDRVRPGGLVVFVTSKGTMDKANDKARKYLAERANLVGAVRLPQTAFKDNAGTEVVTDVLFLQKKGEGIEDNGVQWLGLKEVQTNKGEATSVNEYFADHPEMVLGEHSLTGSMYRANEYTVEPRDGVDIEQAFSEAVARLPEQIYNPERGSKADRAKVIDRDYNPSNRKEGGLYLSEDGKLMQVESGSGVEVRERLGSANKPIALKPKELRWLKGYIGVRDALKQAQYDQLNDGDWEASLATLNRAYDAFVKEHGPILAHSVIERENPDGSVTSTKRFKNKPLWEMDAEGALIFSLERIEPNGAIVKGNVLLDRVLKRPSEPEIKTTQDAMFVSLNRLGHLDIDDVAKLAGIPRDEVIDSLGTAIYEDPSSGWQMADAYLSGNVVRKLEQARAAAELNPKFRRNVDALLAVQPRPLGPTDITVRLGANWVPASDIEAFARDALGESIDVTYMPVTGDWMAVGRAAVAGSEWAAGEMSPAAILNSVLNSRQIKVTYRDSEGKTHTDPVATEQANDVARKMKEAFSRWIWTDTERADRLTKYYNEHFNNISPRQYDGSHLTLPGVSLRFKLHPHQKRAVWRMIQEGDTYLAHSVGAGKTFEMIAGGMEQRRLGLISKPIYTVPNHMLEQFSREFLELYPTAHIMVADEQNFHTNNRRRFLAQAALNNPDAIIITHSAFSRLGMSEEYSDAFIQRQIDEWKAALSDVEGADRITKKQIERRIEQLERRLEGKQSKEKKDQVLTFEELGADYIFVDEMHEFRKLDFATNQGNIKGVDPSGSQRALDLYMKVEYLRGKRPGRSITGASGTPITNTMGELFTVQRFFQPEQLAEDGLDTFDAWAAQYGDTVTGLEQNAAGGYETVTRFAKFQNVPELMRRVRSFMDILTSSNLGELVKRPNVRGGAREIVVTPTPDGYKEYQQQLDARIKAIRNRKGPPKKGEDIILKVISDGRFSALDMRFVDPTLPPDPDSKLNRMLDDVIEAYRETAENEYVTDGVADPLKGSSIIIFVDNGLGEQSAASRGFSMRDWMVKRLTDAGIPAEHVAFMREHKQHAKKERLFADMREGKKRILIGGKDMETGVNVQKRLTHLFHLDAPWFPASVEQREGRIIRQGNQNSVVDVRAYATKGSYDSTMWGMVARKARFIEQAMNGDDSVRSLEDVSEASSFEMAAALASGDERYLRLAGLRGDVERLERLRQAHYDSQNKMRRDKHWAQGEIERKGRQVADFKEAIAKRVPIVAGEFSGKVGGKAFDSRDDFSVALFESFKDLVAKQTDSTKILGEIGGFNIRFDGTRAGSDYFADVHVDVPGADPILSFPTRDDASIAGLATKAANQVNGLDRKLLQVEQDIQAAKRKIEQIDARFGAPFAEEADLLEKVAQLNDLEAELAAESAQAEADAASEQAQDGQAEQASDTTDGGVSFSAATTEADLANQSPVVIRSSASQRGMDVRELRDSVFAGLRDGEGFYHDAIGDIAINRKGWGKSRANANDRAKLLSVPRLADIIRDGVYVGSRPAEGKSGVETYHHIAHRTVIDGVPLIAMVTVEQNADGTVAYYNHTMLDDVFASGGTREAVDSLLAAYRRPLYSVEGNLTREATLPLKHVRVHDTLRQGALGSLIDRFIGEGHIDLHPNDQTLPTSVVERGPIIQGFTERDTGKIHLVTENLTPQTALPVLLHEVFHSQGEKLIGTPKWNNLMRQLDRFYDGAVRRQESGEVREGDFWDGALRRVEAAKSQGMIDPGREAEEFGAYAIENYELAPSGIKKWIDNLIGMVKDFLARRFGIQVGSITPAQLRAMAIAALRQMEGAVPPVNNAFGGAAFGAGGLMSVSDKERGEALDVADSALDDAYVPPAKTDHIGLAIRDMDGAAGLYQRFVMHPYTIASLYKEFTPVFNTGVAQHQERNRVIEDLHTDFRKYQELSQAGKDAVNKVMELGRLTANVYTAEELASGVENPGYRVTVERDENDRPRRVRHPIHSGLTKQGDVIKLKPEEIEAYQAMRSMFDRALDMVRNQFLEEMGFHWMARSLEGHKPLVIRELDDGNIILKGSVYSDKEKADLRAADGDKETIAKILENNPILKVIRKFDGAKWDGKEFGYVFDARQRPALEAELDQFLGLSAEEQIRSLKVNGMTPSRIETLNSMADFIGDIEQSKRQGYVPFARYGDYVVAVKERQADIQYRMDGDDYLATNVPDELTEHLDRIGAYYDSGARAWRMSEAQRKSLEEENEITVYSEKVETGVRDMWGRNAERKVKAGKRPVSQIPSVKKAIDRIVAEQVNDNPMRRIVAFPTTKKRGEAPVDISSLDALAEVAMLDNDTWDSVREQLLKAMQSGGFRKHFFKSSHVPGYSLDFERSNADYIVGLSGYLARRRYREQWDRAIAGIEGEKLHNYALKYRAYVNDPSEEYALLRQTGFFMYIAGNLSSAALNATQVPMMTMPFLTQISSHPQATAQMSRAYQDALKTISPRAAGMDIFDFSKAPADVRDELIRAKEEGLLLPLQSLEVMGIANRRTVEGRRVQKAYDKSVQGLALPFTGIERLNRLVTFIAAVRLSKQAGTQQKIRKIFGRNPMAQSMMLRDGKFDPYGFAEFAVGETQFVMGKLNRPTVMRNVGAPIMQFKSFMLQFLEALFMRWPALQGKQGKRARNNALLMMVLMAGIWGFPGAEDLRELIEKFYKGITKKDFDTRDWLRRQVFDATGSLWLTRLVDSGAFAASGADMSQRIGMGKLMPQTQESTGISWLDVGLAFGGIPVDLTVGRATRFATQLGRGDVGGAVTQLMPNFVENARRSHEWATEGVLTRDQRKMLNPEDVDLSSIIMKSIGFPPTQISELYAGMAAERRSQGAVSELRSHLTGNLARALAAEARNTDPARNEALEKDVTKAFDEILDHNETVTRPEDMINLSRSSLNQLLQRELYGAPSGFGREKRAARGSAEARRQAYGLDRYAP